MTHKRRTQRRGSRARRQRGGAEPYSSGSTYEEHVNGSMADQYNRVFSTSGPYANIPDNVIIGAQGQNASLVGSPSAAQLALIQKAGRRRGSRRHSRSSKKRRGGMLGAALSQAIVPFSILGMQQNYRPRARSSRHARTYYRRNKTSSLR